MAPRLRAYLVARGCPVDDCDDVVQAVAERLLSRELPFSTADDLLPWCIVVARNLTIDMARHAARHPAPHLTCEAVTPSTEEAVWQRLRVERTLSALRTLSARDQDLILAGLVEEPRAALTGRERVARHRARGRLLRLVGPAAVAALLGRIGRSAKAAVPVTVAAALVVTCDLATVLTSPSSPAAPRALVPAQLVERSHVAGSSSGANTSAHRRGSPPKRRTTRGDHHVVRVLTTPDKGHAVVVTGHDRGPRDDGLVCVDGVPLVDHTCVGPTALGGPGRADETGSP